jgi:hypothetical protein
MDNARTDPPARPSLWENTGLPSTSVASSLTVEFTARFKCAYYQEYHHALPCFLALKCSFVADLNKKLNMWNSSIMLTGTEWHNLQFNNVVHRD